MSDEAFAAPTSSQTGAALTPAGEGDYDAICAAVMETVRGRWFLTEYARRNRHADTQLVLAALDRIERGLRGKQSPESIERLRNDLTEMARAIARAKAEIAGVSPVDEGDSIGDVSQELDSVVRATEEATSNILAAAAQIQEVAWSMREQGDDAGLADQLSAYAATIETAASSQKLAGERTQKVVDVMRDLEGRINDMIDVWGGYPGVDNRLLANSARSTPALPPADFVEVEIDAPSDVEPQQNSSDERDATATREASSFREPRNDNGRARSNGHLVLDPSIAAAIRDAASLTNTVGAEGDATTTAHVAEVKDTGSASPGTPPDEKSGDGKDADPSSKSPEPVAQQAVAELPDTQAQDDSHEVEASEKSDRSVVAAPAVDAGGETTSPRRESAPALELISEAVAQEGPEGVPASNVGPNTDAPDAGTQAASPPEETTPSARSPAEANLSHPPAPAVGETAAEPDKQLEPPAEMQADAHTTRDTQEAAAPEITGNARPFVVIDLDLEPLLPAGFDAPASGDAREISGSTREKEASPSADPKHFGWLSEPVTALYDLPPLEVTPPSGTTHAAAPEVPTTRPSQSGSRWPFAFLAPRLRTKPTATESASTETTAPPQAVAAPVATNKMAVATPTPIAFELGGHVVVAPPAVSPEPRRPAVTATPQSAAPEAKTPAVATSAARMVAATATPETSNPDAPVAAAIPPATLAPVAPVVVAAPAPSASQPAVAAPAAAPSGSEPSAAAVPPAASEPVATVAEPQAAASEPSGPGAAAGAPAKPATSSVKVLRPSPPPPADPLAALAALSDEEKLALFS
jgi:hypothetical protein